MPSAPLYRRFDIPYNIIKYERHRPTAIVTLDSPVTLNRITAELAAELALVCQRVEEDPEIHLLALTGSSGVFSSGRTPMPEDVSRGPLGDRLAWLAQMQVAGLIAGLPIPTLVVINGDALDHGMELALAGDMRIAVSHARMGITDLARGGFPWDGGTQRLPRLVGPAWARDMLLTSRGNWRRRGAGVGVGKPGGGTRSTGCRRRAVGRRNYIPADQIAARYAKEAINNGMEVSLTQGLRLEADLNVILQSTEDRAEGLRSFTERRTPRFSGS